MDALSMPDLNDWLLLAHTKGVGPRIACKLLTRFHHPTKIFAANPRELLAAGCSQKLTDALKQARLQQIQPYLQWAKLPGHVIIPLSNPEYPQLLKNIADPPIVLYVWGNVSALNMPAIAIVGSRNATQPGLDTAKNWSRMLSSHGFCIVSGLAKGIDASAHRGTLQDHSGTTVAVLGAGHQYLYPRLHAPLCEQIVAAGGAVISEFPPDTRIHAGNFPRRNRIISGLSAAVVVVEASLRSGSLITARLALEQGKEVFAVPGSIYNIGAQGCNYLIKQGAHLAQRSEDVLESLPLTVKSVVSKHTRPTADGVNKAELSGSAAKLYASLAEQPTSADQLTQKCGLTAAQVSSILVQLEIKGYIYQSGMGLYARSATTPS